MNTLQSNYKIYNLTLTVSSIAATIYAVWDVRGWRLPAVYLIELVVCNFCRKSSNVYLFNFCERISWSVFGQKIIYLQNASYSIFIVLLLLLCMK